jgi:hypothetical protein
VADSRAISVDVLDGPARDTRLASVRHVNLVRRFNSFDKASLFGEGWILPAGRSSVLQWPCGRRSVSRFIRDIWRASEPLRWKSRVGRNVQLCGPELGAAPAPSSLSASTSSRRQQHRRSGSGGSFIHPTCFLGVVFPAPVEVVRLMRSNSNELLEDYSSLVLERASQGLRQRVATDSASAVRWRPQALKRPIRCRLAPERLRDLR